MERRYSIQYLKRRRTLQKRNTIRKRFGEGGGSSDPLITLSGSLVRFTSSKSRPFVSTEVSIVPQQDLHGQDAPYPSGGGKNLVDIPTVTRSSEGSIYPITALPKPISAGEYTVAMTSSAAVAWQMTFRDSSNNIVGTFASSASTVGRQSRTATISAEAASVSIYVNGSTTLSQIQCEAGSTASAYSPYSNICPISGWDAVKVTRTGKNLIDKDNLTSLDGKYLNNLTIANGGGNKGFILPCKGNTEYTMSLAVKNNTDVVVGWFTDYPDTGSVATGKKGLGTYETGSFTFTTGADDKYLFVKYNSTSATQTYTNQQVLDGIMLELGSTATDYEPYQGNTYTIQLGDTVYGGTLTINEDGSGQVVATHALWTKNTTTMDNNNDWPGWKSSGIKDLVGGGYNQTFDNQVLNIGTEYSVNTISSNDILILRTQTYGKTQDEWKALAIDVQIAVELATPTTISLTAQQINTLVGENNVWADSGDIEVTVYGTEIVEPDLNALQSLNILLGNRYVNTHEADEPTDEEALDIILGR